jgi:hypothetical protein
MMTEFEGLARSSGILHDEKEKEPNISGGGTSDSFPKYRSLTNKFPKSTTANTVRTIGKKSLNSDLKTDRDGLFQVCLSRPTIEPGQI